MFASLFEDFQQQIGGAVENLRMVAKSGGAVYIAFEAHDALELDANVRRQFELPANPQPGRGQRLRTIIDDKEFMKQLFPEKQ